MIITDSFIMLNLPKTASTFTRQCVKRAYEGYNYRLMHKFLVRLGMKEEKVKELLLPNMKVSYYSQEKDPHGTYDQIPEKYKNDNRELVSVIRNPFSAYVSRYNFEAWKSGFPVSLNEIKKEFPRFPDLSFSEYLTYSNTFGLAHRLRDISLRKDVQLGVLSVQFIQMFCKNHKKVLSNIDKDYRENGLYENNFPEISFLKTENINDELYDYLLKKGLKAEKIKFIKNKGKVNVSSKKSYQEFLNEDMINKIMNLEWLLFDLFPEYKP